MTRDIEILVIDLGTVQHASYCFSDHLKTNRFCSRKSRVKIMFIIKIQDKISLSPLQFWLEDLQVGGLQRLSQLDIQMLEKHCS